MGDDTAMNFPVVRLDAGALPEVVSVMADAFGAYPLMRFVVGPDGDVAARIHRLVDLFVTRRQRRGGPMLGVHDPATRRLIGAAAFTLPHEADPPPDLAPWVDAVWDELGADAHARYQQYAAVWPVLMDAPHHHLNMLGVRRAWAGQGVARPLLLGVQQMAADDPASAGVSLTTEVERNVAFYEHFGYQCVGHTRLTPDLETWAFVRPNGEV